MKTKRGWAALGIGLVLSVTVSTMAGPSLLVTKPPVVPLSQLTGPPIDPNASQGQWFKDIHGVESVRTNEFHDNVSGGAAGAYAITGYVDSITYVAGPGTPITAFSIQATIRNDTFLGGEWGIGHNSHGETNAVQESPYSGPMVDTKLAAEFAIADTNALPAVFQGPYRDRQPYIEAVNEEQWAWYCWNPEDPNQEHKPGGGYYVPTWDFGTIARGQSATRKLMFTIPAGGLLPGDSRYAPIVTSFASSNDVLMNRTLSLKISTWIDEIALDTGLQQEEPPLRLSDVSVFHNQGEEEPFLDFGDAPDSPYPTLLVNNGARHVATAGVYMGTLLDVEGDGQPNSDATGDDKTSLDDEDGVVFVGQLIGGQVCTVRVTVSTAGYLNAWIDFGADGSWAEGGDQVLNMAFVSAAGTYTYGISVPASVPTTNSFARFRFSTPQTALSYIGQAADGEVEDYAVGLYEEQEEPMDFGDAMDSLIVVGYPTLLANNGARHILVSGVYLGARADAEIDGQPTLNADGDDLNPPFGLDDEDGVTLPPVLVAGAVPQVEVVASTNGFLNAWIDWNANGTWVDPGEQVAFNHPLTAGTNFLAVPVPVPPALVAGGPHSRWRFTTYAPLVPSVTGYETDGEVEDYEVHLEVLDFGDAPDPAYPTLLASDGARHRIPSAYWLGALAPDLESDGQPDATATGDDLAGSADEDGVSPSGSLVRGQAASFSVVASTGGVLNGWMDFNGDGDWTDAGEQIAADWLVPAGTNLLPATVPADSHVGPVPGRFRFASVTGIGLTGLAPDGEVEDHTFTIYQNGPDTNIFEITNIVHVATNTMAIWWAGDTGVVYETQFTRDLTSTDSPPWEAWGAYVTGDPLTQVDTNASATTTYYRVVAPYSPPPP